MRIGVMLRCLEEPGGIAVYAQNLVEELLRLDAANHYVLFHRRASTLGRFAPRANVTERLVRGAGKVAWDQVSIPWRCWRDRIDVLFHPKFTAPLLAPCRAVMVVHGADWYRPEETRYYSWLNVKYLRAVLPLYFRKCAVVLSVSQRGTDDFTRELSLPPGKIRTVYFGPARHFRRVVDPVALEVARKRYGLPGRFILTLTKPGGGDRKNLRRLLEAYQLYAAASREPLPLVVAGNDGAQLCALHGATATSAGRLVFPGWVEQSDLPAVYSLSALFLYPSNLEAFPIPVTEAMACGVPVITSDLNGLKEIAGDACLLVNPGDPVEIAAAIARLASDPRLAAELSARGMRRAADFDWATCARRTLAILEGVATIGPAGEPDPAGMERSR